MNLQKKVKVTLILVLICLVLAVAASYAWVVLSLRPEVNRVDTNIGANGSLEIALLTEQTYADPVSIRTMIGDSAASQDVLESNKSWGNVIELNEPQYGLSKISLLPARLNVSRSGEQDLVGENLLKIANYGIDGRMTILSEDTVSAIYGENAFTYYVDRQLYGVRAIGSISNLTAQQTALAVARSSVKANTAAASRTVKYTWRDQGGAVMDMLFRHYSGGEDQFGAADVAAIQNMANGLLEVTNYVDAALRQGIIGVAASQISDETQFENICAIVSNTAMPLSDIIAMVGSSVPEQFVQWAKRTDEMKSELRALVAGSYMLIDGGTWEQVEPLLNVMLDARYAYLGEKPLTDKTAFDAITGNNILTLSPDCGMLGEIAAYAGNYSAFTQWAGKGTIEARTADPNPVPYLIQIETILENCKAAVGGWSRANMDDTYGFAVDLAFRCNRSSELLLQTAAAQRVSEGTEATQGGGSYMRFTSDNMDLEQLLQLMDTIRIGFIGDRNTLLGVAKLNITSYEEQEEGVYAPLYLYDYALEDDGSMTIGERRSDDAYILDLPQNAPVVVTVVVWLDGDYVENSMVSDMAQQSMNGVLNLQFSSSADLLPSNQPIKD